MVTPYDWQEAIGHRAQFVESRLATGSPVLAVSIDAGVLIYTVRKTARKVYEIYDRLMLGAMGQQSDVEAVRTAAIDFTHREGYGRSSSDVTIQRVAASLSQPLKQAFADFNTAPLVVRALLAQVGGDVDSDRYYVLEYDGDFLVKKGWAFVSATEEQQSMLIDRLGSLDRTGLSTDAAIDALRPLWCAAISPGGERSESDLLQGLTEEVALLERGSGRQRCFQLLRGGED